MAQEKEKIKTVDFDNDKLRRREKRQRDLERRKDKFDKGVRRKR